MTADGQFIVTRPINDVINTLQDQHRVWKIIWVIGGAVLLTYTPITHFVDATSFETRVRFRKIAILGFKAAWISFSFNGNLETISPEVTCIHFETKVREFNPIRIVVATIVMVTFFGIVSQSLTCPALVLIFIGASLVISKYHNPYSDKIYIRRFLNEVFEEEPYGFWQDLDEVTFR